MSDRGATIIYLAGDRELHAPAQTLEVEGDLELQLTAAERLPIAAPPDQQPVTVQPGQVQLLRLDRVAQKLESDGIIGPFRFLFVLTRQEDPRYRGRDTHQLSAVLGRWCEARGHRYDEVVLTGPANRLDGAGAELLARLDEALSGTEGPVVLVAGGGTAALQTSAHFAAFRGVRYRDQLTIVQLEEVVGQQASDTPAAAARRPPIVDSDVRIVDRFHGVVGRRTIIGQAQELLDQLDLPGAAQLLRAAGSSGLIDDEPRRLADQLLRGLTRSHSAGDPLTALSHAIDLAEVEWSRPGGSHLEAIWYAALACIDLLPDARVRYAGLPESLAIAETAVDAYNDQAGPKKFNDRFNALQMAPRTLRTKVGPLLCAGPRSMRLPGRTIAVDALCGVAFRGDDPTPGTIWAAMVVAYKPLRNDAAHGLMTGTREEAERTLRDTSELFTYAAAMLDGTPDAHRLCPVRDERLDAVLAALSRNGSARGNPSHRPPWKVHTALAAGTEALVEVLTDEQVPASRFGQLAGQDRQRIVDLIEELRAGPGPEAQALREQLSSGEPEGLGALGLNVSAERTGSSFRRLCRMLVPDLPSENRLLADARSLQHALQGSDVPG